MICWYVLRHKNSFWLLFHQILHQYNMHKYNFLDVSIWDKLFATYGDTTDFAPRCGFPRGAEQKLASMLIFKAVGRDWRQATNAATWSLEPRAIVSFLCGVAVWLESGGVGWLSAALLVGAVVPFTFAAALNIRRLKRGHDMLELRNTCEQKN
jgi:hypothetical protein